MISRKIYTNDNPDKGVYKGFSQCQRLCLHCLDFHNLLNILPVYQKFYYTNCCYIEETRKSTFGVEKIDSQRDKSPNNY